jgi:hypothetical protein
VNAAHDDEHGRDHMRQNGRLGVMSYRHSSPD